MKSPGGSMKSSGPEEISRQVAFWVEQIEVRQANGLDLQTAAGEVKLSFEARAPLSDDECADLSAAEAHIAARTRPGSILVDHSLRRKGRPEWYAGPTSSDRYWPKLRAYLSSVLKRDDETVRSIDRTSSEIVSLFANPSQAQFRGRGLVVGYVQSGKTANMTAVIAKAADAGYRFVIVLAGLTNSLRYQTQTRLAKDLFNRDPYAWYYHTSEELDFRLPATRWFNHMDQVQVAIVKKNVTPLGHLRDMITATPPKILKKLQILIIDDECDQASVNSSEYSITAINGLIREILARTPLVQYVGYTATPFANVLINPYPQPGRTDDLYPEDFITALPKPAAYFGAAELFGQSLVDADATGEDAGGLAMIREIPAKEAAALRPPSRKTKDDFQPSIPPTLETALRYFLLVNACRRARGQEGEHSSMLVHSTVYTIVHEKIADLLVAWRRSTLRKLGQPAFLDELRALWEAECVKVPAARLGREATAFDDLAAHLAKALGDTEIVVENAASDERLDYASKVRTYIVVGGSVLARGLTIEGLAVSYFLRSSNQYDTLLQMGRWFGYRPGYEDLPRIWMPSDLSSAFRDLSRVELEIREDIADYIRLDVTPLDFAVRIPEIPGLAVTTPAKMHSAQRVEVSFSNKHPQTIRLRHLDPTIVAHNWRAGGELIAAADQQVGRSDRAGAKRYPGGHLYRGVSHERVRAFLAIYRHEPNFPLPDLLKYIDAEAARVDDPVRAWNVGVIESKDGELAGKALGPLEDVRCFSRARMEDLRNDAADIKSLMSRGDVLFDVEAPHTGKWPELKGRRNAALGQSTPLLLLYPIHKVSPPRDQEGDRVALDAVDHVLGLGLVMPERPGSRTRIAVALNDPDPAETEDLEGELAAATAESAG
jgi:hypothetical protein